MEHHSLALSRNSCRSTNPPNLSLNYKRHDACTTRNSDTLHKHRPEVTVSTPGPQYCVYDVTRNGKTSGPKFSLGSKLEQGSWIHFPKFQTPGPGSYSPDDNYALKWKRAPSFSIGHRFRAEREKVGPGPNCYLLTDSSKQNNSGFSLGLRLPEKKVPQIPGPGAYEISDLETYKTRQPRIKMTPTGTVHIVKKPQVFPGPNAYLPTMDPVRKNGPKFSFGMRHSTKSQMHSIM